MADDGVTEMSTNLMLVRKMLYQNGFGDVNPAEVEFIIGSLNATLSNAGVSVDVIRRTSKPISVKNVDTSESTSRIFSSMLRRIFYFSG